jgi:uncharacterized protein (DUF1778 family)
MFMTASSVESTMAPRSLKPQSARLEARISHDLHLTVKRAAEIQGRTMTDFVIHALQEAASEAIEQSDQVRLSIVDQEAFAHALIATAKPNAALKRAFAKANKLLAA